MALSSAYDKKLRALCRETAKNLGFDFIQEGVYMMQSGPCFETIAECKMALKLGADVLGEYESM